MDVKQKQRAVIEFLLLEGCEDDAIALRLQNATVEMHTVELRYSDG
jgi:hypothetical protein